MGWGGLDFFNDGWDGMRKLGWKFNYVLGRGRMWLEDDWYLAAEELGWIWIGFCQRWIGWDGVSFLQSWVGWNGVSRDGKFIGLG